MLAKHPDPTVAHVLETWAPRMIVQGIDYNDLMTTGARIRVWGENEGQRTIFLPLTHCRNANPLPTWLSWAKGLCKDLLADGLWVSFSMKADRKLS